MKDVLAVFKHLAQRKPDVEFFTRLPVEDCQQRLSMALDRWRWFANFRPDKPVIGKVSGRRFQMHKRIYYRNSFMPILHGELIPTSQGTFVRASFRFHILTTMFMVAWFGGTVFLLLRSVGPVLFGTESWLALVIPVGFLTFGMLLVWIGSLLEKPSKAFVIAYLRRILLDSPPELTTASPPIPATSEGLAWQHILISSLGGALLIMPGVGLQLLNALGNVSTSSEIHDLLYSVYARLRPPEAVGVLLWLAGSYAPMLSGFFFAFLGARRSRLVHPVSMTLGGVIAASPLGWIAGLAGLPLFILSPPGLVDLFWKKPELSSLFTWSIYTITFVIGCGFLGGFGGYLGWLFLARKEIYPVDSLRR